MQESPGIPISFSWQLGPGGTEGKIGNVGACPPFPHLRPRIMSSHTVYRILTSKCIATRDNPYYNFPISNFSLHRCPCIIFIQIKTKVIRLFPFYLPMLCLPHSWYHHHPSTEAITPFQSSPSSLVITTKRKVTLNSPNPTKPMYPRLLWLFVSRYDFSFVIFCRLGILTFVYEDTLLQTHHTRDNHAHHCWYNHTTPDTIAPHLASSLLTEPFNFWYHLLHSWHLPHQSWRQFNPITPLPAKSPPNPLC